MNLNFVCFEIRFAYFREITMISSMESHDDESTEQWRLSISIDNSCISIQNYDESVHRINLVCLLVIIRITTTSGASSCSFNCCALHIKVIIKLCYLPFRLCDLWLWSLSFFLSFSFVCNIEIFKWFILFC